ncbi:MAG: lactate utilization protein [Acidobacteria bacterium]|nr:lactate utilization protein [Acidobacteriota bacterium]
MTSREQILSDVRKALGRTAGQAPAAQPKARIVIPTIAVEERVRLFQERLEVLGGKVHRAATYADAARVVGGLIEGTAVASNAAVLRYAGVTAMAGVSSGYGDEPSLRAACASAPFGITGADYGLAETGSIVTVGANEARLVSLLPPVHIALLSKSRMLTGLDEFYTLHPRPALASASTVFITGPSRSADIEMILVRGVHGPRVIHVIVVDEELI